jgi:predicted MFS family arabinose efflux permease
MACRVNLLYLQVVWLCSEEMKYFVVVAAITCCACFALAITLPPPSPSEAHFIDLSAKFRKFHSDPINVALHFLTTPLGILAVLSLINKVFVRLCSLKSSRLWFSQFSEES